MRDHGHVLHHLRRLAVHFGKVMRSGLLRAIDDGELHIHGHLRGGETHAVRIAHGLDHVIGELADLGRDLGHRTAFGAEDGFGVADVERDHTRPYHRGAGTLKPSSFDLDAARDHMGELVRDAAAAAFFRAQGYSSFTEGYP